MVRRTPMTTSTINRTSTILGKRALGSFPSWSSSNTATTRHLVVVTAAEQQSMRPQLHRYYNHSQFYHHKQCRRSLSSSIGRMLDMGGAPSASNDRTLIRTVNASKNSKLQAVVFDFEILVSDASASDASTTTTTTTTTQHNTDAVTATTQSFQPDLAKINEVASLLNVKMDASRGSVPASASVSINLENNNNNSIGDNKPQSNNNKTNTSNTKNPLLDNDVRSKYAAKLQKVGITGGVREVDYAKSQLEDTLRSGDAAGHLAARKVAISHDADTNISNLSGNNKTTKGGTGSRWMALAGVGRLLSYLTHRSIRIALLPSVTRKDRNNSSNKNDSDDGVEESSMNDLAQQLKKDVVIDVIVPSLFSSNSNNNNAVHGDDDDYTTAKRSLQKNVLDTLEIDPNRVLIVTDKDLYLKAGRDLGLLTCRLQPKTNKRRGNITTHYNISNTVDVRDVVDEINGISFNTVLNR